MKLSKVLSLLAVVAIVGAAMLTAVQTAYAFDIPSGCWETSHSTWCARCGFLWLYGKPAEKWTWKCPNGGGGSQTEYGSCGACNP